MGKQERFVYRRARRRVRDLMNFYRHVIIYVILQLFFLIINIMTGNGQWLTYGLVLLGWGLIIAIHALFVFAINTLFTGEWEEKRIKEYMDRKLKRPKSE